MIDFNKPVQTRDGRKARILCADLQVRGYPVVVAVMDEWDHHEYIYQVDKRGTYESGERPQDIINVPQEETRWVNLYRCGEYGYDYPSKEAANKAAAFQNARVACVKIVFKHGEGLGQ